MRISYVDTSAALKLVVEEPESEHLAAALSTGRDLVASWLLHTEMHCAAGRHPREVPHDSVQMVINAVSLADLSRGDMIGAGTHAPLRSNDAIHLAVAIRLAADEMVTYDAELATAARQAGLAVLSPGA